MTLRRILSFTIIYLFMLAQTLPALQAIKYDQSPLLTICTLTGLTTISVDEAAPEPIENQSVPRKKCPLCLNFDPQSLIPSQAAFVVTYAEISKSIGRFDKTDAIVTQQKYITPPARGPPLIIES